MGSLGTFAINKKSDIPVWVQLKQRITYCILSGQVKSGEQLPTVRELAIELDVNYHTVNKVYRELEDIGLVEVISGKGTFVTDMETWPIILVENDAHSAPKDYAQKLLEMGMTRDEVVRAIAYHLGVPVIIKGATKSAVPTEEADGTEMGHVG